MSLATLPRLGVAALTAALVTLALPAAAATVKVNVAGLDAKTAHAVIAHAAQTACSAALAEEPLRFYAISPCVGETIAATEARYGVGAHSYAKIQTASR